jgi:MoaA/NifB/PqqE/SkfB family radical SAM enzyme
MNIKNIKNKFREKEIFKFFYTKLFYKYFAKFLNGYSYFLNQVFLIPTFSCNLSCVMCGFFGKSGIVKQLDSKEIISFERWKVLVDEIKKYKPKIYFTGGEPLLYRNLFELGEYIKKKNLKLSLQTNGTLLFKSINKIGIFDEINISLDAPKEEINDKIRGDKSYEKVIYSLQQISLKKNKISTKINICYTISDLNYKYLFEMVKFLEESNFKIDNLVFQHLMFVSKEKIEEFKENIKNKKSYRGEIWNGFSYELKDIDIDILLDEIEKIKKYKNPKFNIKFFPDFTKRECKYFYSDSNFLPERFSKYCLTPFLDVIIFPDGDVYSCQGYVIGNIKENNFESLWNNVYSKEIRVKIIKEGIFSVCRACCGKYIY